MFKRFNGRVFAIGVAITSGATTLAAVKARDTNETKEDDISTINDNRIEKRFQSNDNNQDFSPNESIINSCVHRLSQWRLINGIPGFVVGVSLKGRNVWIHSEGFADIENGVKCNDKTVMRIASISKSMTSLLLAQLIQQKRIDLDKPIGQYLTRDQFPDKYWEGKKVDITLRQLASHLGGIRHYKKEEKEPENQKDSKKDADKPSVPKSGEFSAPEYYLKESFPTVMDSLRLFKDDPLIAKPGTKYNYTTFGYTLISAVIESQLNGEKFDKYLIKFLRQELGLENTYLDQYEPIIPNRSHYYVKTGPNGRLSNAPYVDNSYKWAGGGLLSNVYDLLKFGNIMLYSYEGGVDGKPGIIDKEIIDLMWTPALNTKLDWDQKFGGYGLGWGVVKDEHSKYAFCVGPDFPTILSHTGGAVGATSVLLIEPNNEMIVTIIANLSSASGIYRIALDIAKEFARTDAFGQPLPIITHYSNI